MAFRGKRDGPDSARFYIIRWHITVEAPLDKRNLERGGIFVRAAFVKDRRVARFVRAAFSPFYPSKLASPVLSRKTYARLTFLSRDESADIRKAE